jgi:type IV pilus assembly protein PilQ
MKLEKPERIAVDIFGADSSLVGKKIIINRFGVGTVRVGRNKGFLRVVLDTTHHTFPKYQVKPSATGILVEFTQ